MAHGFTSPVATTSEVTTPLVLDGVGDRSASCCDAGTSVDGSSAGDDADGEEQPASTRNVRNARIGVTVKRGTNAVP